MKTVKYIEITSKIMEEIRSGMFKPGDRLYSRSELMKCFHVGEVTAVRVQNELAKSGYVRKVRGGGIFVTCRENISFAERLKQWTPKTIDAICVFRYKAAESKYRSFHDVFYQEIERYRKEGRIPCEYHDYTPQQVSDTRIPTLPTPDKTGYLGIFNGPMSMFYTANIFLNPLLHNVLLDSCVPGSNAVLTDSSAGMEKLADYAVECGYRDFIVARNFSSSFGEFYDTERFSAVCRYLRKKGLSLQTLENGSFNDLILMVSRIEKPFCVMFMQDALALRFCHLTALTKLPKHLVTGFDNFPGMEKPDFPVATIAVDHKAMVQAAFRLLEAPMAPRKEIVRIPGTFLPEITVR